MKNNKINAIFVLILILIPSSSAFLGFGSEESNVLDWYEVAPWEIAVCMQVVPPDTGGAGFTFITTPTVMTQLTYTIQAQREDYEIDDLNYSVYSIAYYIQSVDEGGQYDVRIINNRDEYEEIASGTMIADSYSGSGGFEVFEDNNKKNFNKAILRFKLDSATEYTHVAVNITQ